MPDSDFCPPTPPFTTLTSIPVLNDGPDFTARYTDADTAVAQLGGVTTSNTISDPDRSRSSLRVIPEYVPAGAYGSDSRPALIAGDP